VVLQLRPGNTKDRRRRTDPHWMSGPMLRIRSFGRLNVESAEGQIGGSWIDQRTGQLLRYLVAERHRSVHIEEIGESIWTDADFGIANSVRYYVHALRRKIEPQRDKRAPSSFITSHAGSYRLNLERVQVDADEFEARVSAGLAAVERDPEFAAGELEQGLTLYRGDFLADMPYADWAMAERHRLHDMASIALRTLADIRLRGGMPTTAIRHLERLATMQPYDEKVHRELMELDVAVGRRSDAIRRYNSLRSRMRRTFGHDLDFTPADLAAPESLRSEPDERPRRRGRRAVVSTNNP
jgi:DNA-binding SARP family transcriptional activator